MYIIAFIGIIILRLIYFFLKLLPTKNRIVFISRQSDKPSIDFRMLSKELEKRNSNIEIVFITKKMKKNIKSIIKSTFVILKQMYYLATSRVCIVDGYNIPVSVLKHKKNLKVIQIWHSLAAIKKFGYQSLYTSRDKKISKIMKMHKNYDFIVSGSSYMIPYFSKAFNVEQSKFYPIGLPRIDYLLLQNKINRKKILSKYEELKHKKNILIVPTFRDNKNYKINELINEFDLSKYNLIVKIHPNMEYTVIDKKGVFTCDEFTSLQLLSVADFVITDYSAISVEAAVLNKPIFLYVYDIDEYSISPGLNVDLNKELSGYVFKNSKQLYKKLSTGSYNMKTLKKFKDNYVAAVDCRVTERLADFILKYGEVYEKN